MKQSFYDLPRGFLRDVDASSLAAGVTAALFWRPPAEIAEGVLASAAAPLTGAPGKTI